MSPTSSRPVAEPFRVTRRRHRVPVSCGPCRSKKLRCDRGSPCSNCERRRDGASCTYATESRDRRRLTTAAPASNLTPSEVQNRIDRLEDLVLLLMNNNSSRNGGRSVSRSSARMTIDSTIGSPPSSREHTTAPTTTTTTTTTSSSSPPGVSQSNESSDYNHMMDNDDELSDTESVTRSFGAMKVNSDESRYYISESHWASVLNNLNDVRKYLDERAVHERLENEVAFAGPPPREEQNTFDPDPILGGCKLMTESEIRDRFPPRHIADELIEMALSPTDYVTSIIHAPTYRKQYENHWKDPSKSSLAWIAMSFGLMRRGAHARTMLGCSPAELDPKLREEVRQLRFYIIQCLMLLNYTQPHRYIIEIFLLFLWGSSETAEDYNWIVASLLTRLAMRMGYHRDPRGFPNISPFEGEMRRRVWCLVRQADIWFSYLAGMPSIVPEELTDSEDPKNISDEDLHEDIVELPPSKPAYVETSISFLNVKGNVLKALNHVLHHVQKPCGASYDEVMRIDQELRAARDSAPTFLWPGDFSGDRPVFNVYLGWAIYSIYHKAQCVLHRRFLRVETENSRYEYSRSQVIESARRLLQLQALLNTEAKPGGHLQGLITHLTLPLLGDLIMAAFLLTMHVLQLRSKNTGAPVSASASSPIPSRASQEEEEILSQLHESYEIWGEHRDFSKLTLKAHVLLSISMDRLKERTTSAPSYDYHEKPDGFNRPSVARANNSGMPNFGANAASMPGGDGGGNGVIPSIDEMSADPRIPASSGVPPAFDNNSDMMDFPPSSYLDPASTTSASFPMALSQTQPGGAQMPMLPTPTSATATTTTAPAASVANGVQGAGVVPDVDMNPLMRLSMPLTPYAWMESLANVPESDLSWNTNLWDSYVKNGELMESSMPLMTTDFASPEEMQIAAGPPPPPPPQTTTTATMPSSMPNQSRSHRQ